MKLLSATEWASYQGEFIALWTGSTHAYALYEPGELVAVMLQDGAYPSLPYPGADWFQRLAKDLNGHIATGFQPIATAIEQFRASDGTAAWPDFVGPAEEGVHQIALGPVYGDVTEPAHFRLFLQGEKIFKLQMRLGYAHRDILGLLRGKSPRQAARYAARISGDATVAHAVAFARAAEQAMQLEVSVRAHGLRAVMAEWERLANHCGDIGMIARITGATKLWETFWQWREQLAIAAQAAWGHRLMMDVVVPGGVTKDMAEAGYTSLHDVLAAIEHQLPALQAGFESSRLCEHLKGVGVIPLGLARAYHAGGCVGRASGVARDARVYPGYPPYELLDINLPVEHSGDVAARIRIRFAEITQAITLIRTILAGLPNGPVAVVLPVESGMGLGVAESFRGPVWHWLNIENGHIRDAFVADASAAHWAVLEHAAQSTNLVDFPLLERSINPSAASVDG